MATLSLKTKTRALTRDKLASFLTSHEAIKVLENLTADVSASIPDAVNDREVVNVWMRNQSTAQVDLKDAPVVLVDASLSNGFRLLLSSSVGVTRKLGNPTNATSGMLLAFAFVQPSAGSLRLTFDSSYDFGPQGTPTLSTAPFSRDLMIAYFDGEKWVCEFRGSGGASEAFVTLSDSGSITPVASKSTNFLLPLTAGVGATRSLQIPVGIAGASIVNFNVVQPPSGGPCAIVWGAGYRWGRGGQDPQPIGSTVPGATDTYSFQVQADGNLHGVMIGQSGPTGAGYAASSTTSLTPSVTSKALTTQSGLAYSVGARARATSASTGDYFEGLVTAYSSGVLTINADTFSGSTARTDWNINLAGNVGTTGSQGIPGSAGTGNGVNLQTGTTYTYLTSDASKLVSHSNAASIAATLPQATGSFASPFVFDVENRGVGTLTITPTTSTIDGATSLPLTTNQGCRIFSDGTNWYTQRGMGSGSSGGVGYAVVIGNGAGDITGITGTYANVSGMSGSIAAAVGNRVEVQFNALMYCTSGAQQNAYFQILVNGVARSFDQFGQASNTSPGTTTTLSLSFPITIASGDISGGLVSVQLQWKGANLALSNSGAAGSSLAPTLTLRNYG